MKNKKLLSILLALTLAFSAVGCGAAGGGSVDKSLTATRGAVYRPRSQRQER